MKLMIFFRGFLIFIAISSCSKDFRVDTSPKGDFELFFEYMEKDYSYRDYHGFTMADLRNKYLPQIKASNTKSTLANILVSIENELKDPHVYFEENDIYELSKGFAYENPSLERVLPVFTEITIKENTPYYTFGTVAEHPEIGYLYIRSFNDDVGGTSSLSIMDGVRKIDNIIKYFNDEGITSTIVDMRSGAGGSSYVPRYIAQRFIDKVAVYMVEYYPREDTYVKKEWQISPSGTGFREGKIALLSNGKTASGGEMFVLGMLQRENLIHIGSTSGGLAGNVVDKDLSNGWNFLISNSRTELPDGTQYFKVGILPSIIVRNNEPLKIGDNDKLIQRAIKELAF